MFTGLQDIVTELSGTGVKEMQAEGHLSNRNKQGDRASSLTSGGFEDHW